MNSNFAFQESERSYGYSINFRPVLIARVRFDSKFKCVFVRRPQVHPELFLAGLRRLDHVGTDVRLPLRRSHPPQRPRLVCSLGELCRVHAVYFIRATSETSLNWARK